MTDLFPGMTINISTVYAAASKATDRPAWLAESAQWPPVPDGVMYMIEDTSTGICDQCILTWGDKISNQVRGSQKVVERGNNSPWYCNINYPGCDRYWTGSGYTNRRW